MIKIYFEQSTFGYNPLLKQDKKLNSKKKYNPIEKGM